jgi:tetratricopeptide (TPR) repeat protein
VNVLQLCEDLGYEDDLQVGRARLLCIKNLALLEEEDGEFRSAIEYLVEGLRVDPSDAVSALRLARLALTHFGNVRLARGALEAALRADPHFWPALTLLMEMLYSLGDDLGCLEAASRCLAEQPYFVRALEIRASVLVRNGAVGRAHECKFEGMSKVPEKSLEIVQPRARGDVAEVRAPLNVRVSILSWPHVTSQIVAKLKVCGFLSLAVSWAEARVPVVGNSGAAVVVVEDSNPPPEESTTNVASPAKQIVLRNEIEQQQQADFRKMLEEMFPWSSVLRKGGEVIADHAPDASSGSVLAAQAEDVRSWLSKLEDKMEPVHLLNELCEELFSRVKDPWDSLLQRSGNALGRIVLLWDVRPREYFLGLAELAVDACNAAPSVRSSTASSLVMVKKLLERFCFEFPAVLTSKQVTETILRVERVKGLLCKLLGEGDCIEHFRGVKAMLATLSTPQVHLPHSRVVVNSEWVERELALVDQAEQCRVALAHFKSKDFAKVVQTLSPVLLLGPPVQLDAKRKLQLLEKLYASVKELRGSELGKLFPRVVLLYLSELRARDDSPLTVSASSDMRGILAEVRKMDVSEWSVEDRLKIQCHCASLVAACRGNKQFAGLLANAWETLFFFVERPLTQAGLNLLQMALSTVVEVEACRLNRGSFLRLVISEMLPGIQRFRGDEDPPDEWSWALHQAIQCLFGVRMPNVKKGHKCEVKGEESMLEQLAEVFEYVGSNLQDSGMSNLSRKIYHHFSVLPAQLHTRFADVQAMVFDGAQDDAPPGAVLRLPEKVRDGQNIPHFAVYQEIYALHVVHVLPGKVCKRLHNKSRQVLRSATQRKWFDSKSPEEAKKILLLDLTVNPDRFESWFMLGMLLRATADHRLVMESCLLKDFSADAQKKQSETRAAAMRCFQRSLLCNTSEGLLGFPCFVHAFSKQKRESVPSFSSSCFDGPSTGRCDSVDRGGGRASRTA